MSARSTLRGKLILLVEALVLPLSHLINGCNCWSSSSMEALTNCRCQTLVGGIKGALKISWQAWSVLSERLTLVSALILLGRVFGPPLEPLEERLYLLVEVKC